MLPHCESQAHCFITSNECVDTFDFFYCFLYFPLHLKPRPHPPGSLFSMLFKIVGKNVEVKA